jgi:hypothetical protein
MRRPAAAAPSIDTMMRPRQQRLCSCVNDRHHPRPGSGRVQRSRSGLVLAVLVSSGLLSACTTNSPPLASSSPCCHVLLGNIPAAGGSSIRQSFRVDPEPQGAWSPIEDVTASGPVTFAQVYDVAQAAVMASPLNMAGRETHELYVGGPGALLGYRHQDENGKFGAFFTLPSSVPADGDGGPLGTSKFHSVPFSRVAATMVGQDLEVCAIGHRGSTGFGEIYHATRIRAPGATPGGGSVSEGAHWAVGGNATDIWDDIGLGGAGQGDGDGFRDVGCATVNNPATDAEELNVCAVSGSGSLFHSVRGADGKYSPFVDVGKLAGLRSYFGEVSCAGEGKLLYLVATHVKDLDALAPVRAEFTVHTPAGWRPFTDVRTAASTPLSDLDTVNDVAIGFCNTGVPPSPPQNASQLNIVLLRASGTPVFGKVTNTVFTQGATTWSPLLPPSSWMPREIIPDSVPSAEGKYTGISLVERPFRP